jgi:hypothetical protein
LHYLQALILKSTSVPATSAYQNELNKDELPEHIPVSLDSIRLGFRRHNSARTALHVCSFFVLEGEHLNARKVRSV